MGLITQIKGFGTIPMMILAIIAVVIAGYIIRTNIISLTTLAIIGIIWWFMFRKK